MASELYGYFDSTDDDIREYDASEFANILRAVLTNGITSHNGGGLEVTADGLSMQTIISPGGCVINGYLYVLQDDGGLPKSMTHAPSGSADRIDRIVCRLDVRSDKRKMTLEVLEGTPSAEPEPPELTRTDQIYDLSLCQVLISAGVTAIEQTDITSEQSDSESGGTAYPVFSYSKTKGDALESMVMQMQSALGTAVDESEVKNDLETTDAGYVLDARQGKTLSDRLTTAQTTATNAQNTASSKASTATYTVLFSADDWSADAPYTQTVSVPEIVAVDNPLVDIVSLAEDRDTASAQLEAFGCIGQILTDTGEITATCFEDKPEADFTLQLKVIR